MNYNKNKDLIYEKIKELKTHPTADEVFEILKAENPKLGIATVYRNLNELTEDGKLYRIQKPYTKDRYDANIEPHIHAECNSCGKVIDVDCEVDFKIKDKIDFEGYELKLKYKCNSCNKKTN